VIFGTFLARSARATFAVGLLTAACALQAKSSPFSAPSQATAASTSFNECPDFFANRRPPAVQSRPQLRALCYDAFAVLHNGSTKTPVYVAQRLNRALVEDADEKRTNRFFADARLPRSERAELEDYKRSGYSRGHMAPAGDMPTAQAMAQSFSLANMVPQSSEQNSGPWARIEQDTRRYARRAQGDVFIITGPVFQGDPSTIGPNHVRVPSHLFKLVYDAQTKRAWVHWQPNGSHAAVTRPISYQELVKRTGIEFLPGIQVH
jgi:endonuclease G